MAVLDKRMVKHGNQAATQVLIRWKGKSPAESSWDFATEMQARFPKFTLIKTRDLKGRVLLQMKWETWYGGSRNQLLK